MGTSPTTARRITSHHHTSTFLTPTDKLQSLNYTMSKDIEEKRLKKEKKDKKDKKEKKVKGDVEMVDALEAELEKEPEVSMVNVVDGSDEPRGALVPFAFPL